MTAYEGLRCRSKIFRSRKDRGQVEIWLSTLSYLWSGNYGLQQNFHSLFVTVVIKYHHKLPSLHSFICPNLVLVVGIAVAEVSNEPDEVCLKADDRRIRRRVSISTEGGEVLSSTENILTGLPSGVYLLQELCMDSLWQTTGKAEHLLRSSIKLFRL